MIFKYEDLKTSYYAIGRYLFYFNNLSIKKVSVK